VRPDVNEGVPTACPTMTPLVEFATKALEIDVLLQRRVQIVDINRHRNAYAFALFDGKDRHCNDGQFRSDLSKPQVLQTR